MRHIKFKSGFELLERSWRQKRGFSTEIKKILPLQSTVISRDLLDEDKGIAREVVAIQTRQALGTLEAGNEATRSAVDDSERLDNLRPIGAVVQELIASAAAARVETFDELRASDVREAGKGPEGLVSLEEAHISRALGASKGAASVVIEGVVVEDTGGGRLSHRGDDSEGRSEESKASSELHCCEESYYLEVMVLVAISRDFYTV